MDNVFISNWTVTLDLNRISEGDRIVPIEPQVMEVIVFLAEHPGADPDVPILQEARKEFQSLR